MLSSVSRFTSSLVGTLFAALPELHSSPRRVAEVPADAEQGGESGQRGTAGPKLRGQASGAPSHVASQANSSRRGGPPRPDGLSSAQQAQIRELKARDREVRSHEQAHVAAGGSQIAGGPRYALQTGPDGRQYAVGGSVSIDAAPADAPEETLRRAQNARRAALAPSQPSAEDLAVAANAAQLEAQARMERLAERRESAETGQVPAAAFAQVLAAEPTVPAVEEGADAPGSRPRDRGRAADAYRRAADSGKTASAFIATA